MLSLSEIKNWLHPTPPVALEPPSRPLPTEDEYVALIQSAQKADHQIYTEEKLKSVGVSLNASRPSLIQVVTLPYTIACHTLQLARERIKQVSHSLEQSHYQLAAHILNFVQSALIPITYLTAAGFLVVEGCALFVTINFLALCTSLLEMCLNAYQAHEQYQFSKTFDISLLRQFSKLTAALTRQELRLNLPKLIKKLTAHCKNTPTEYQAKAIQELHRIKEQLKKPEAHFTDSYQALQQLFTSFQYQFITHKMELFQKQFFEISSKEQVMIENKSRHFYKTCDYPKALHCGFSLVQDIFLDKKILLGKRVQPWLATEIIHKQQSIMTHLKSSDPEEATKGIHEAISLLERANYNSGLKQRVALANMALFVIVALYSILSILSVANPFLSILSVGGSALIYYFNSFRINAILNSKSYDIDWKNCCPPWLKTCGRKIHEFFFKKQKTHPIRVHALEITADVPRRTPTPTPPLKPLSYFEQFKTFLPQKLKACL